MIHTLVIFHVQPGRTAELEADHRKLVALMGAHPAHSGWAVAAAAWNICDRQRLPPGVN
jgi:hypothetical protein